MQSDTSAFARLFLRVTNSETGRGDAESRNERPVERKLLMEQASKVASWLGAEWWSEEGNWGRDCCLSCGISG
jgi:hypothetical protein